jgi:hypothetical protein
VRSLPELVSLAVLQHLPFVSCFTCIASELHTPESAVRNAAQMLVLQQAFRPTRHLCFQCLRTEQTIMRDKDSD